MVLSTLTQAVAGPRAGLGAPRRLVHLVLVVLVDAVPLVGIVYFDWSVARCLIAFWGESMVQGVLVLARILIHRAMTHDSGYSTGVASLGVVVNGHRVTKGSYPMLFAGTTFGFSIVHGIFLFVLLLVLGDGIGQNTDWTAGASDFSLLKGLGLMACFQMLDFLHDLVGLRHWPFAWIKAIVDRLQTRIVILHIGIIAGFFVIAFLHVQSLTPILVAVVVIKTLVDLAAESG
ncbi:hypothetical protein GCM10009105_08690 [Dokdonella soli]|uniref:Uncharacterized protein n=2 Tax=Dokdonella soli TaxID=529810 RepID=A0ABN1IDH5_9GAMM